MLLGITMINFVLSLVPIFFLFSFLLNKFPSSKIRPPLPPGPTSLPYIGSIISMLRNKPTFRWIHSMMDKMNTKILCIRLGNTHVIAVSDPKIALEFLKDTNGIFSSRPDTVSGHLTSNGYLNIALAPIGDHWKKMRKVLSTEILSVARHKWLLNKRIEEYDNILRYIYKKCDNNRGGVMNAHGEPGDKEIEHVDSLLTILAYTHAFCVTDYFPWLRWITDFDGHEKTLRNGIITARKYQDPLIDERIRQWKNGVKTKQDDLLDVFINLRNPRLTTDEIKAQILDLTLASLDNVSNNIEWAMAEMINKPGIFDKAVNELDFVVGKDGLVQESDLQNLNYIKACVKEAFRLHPVAPFNVPHVTTVDSIVAGYFIPTGSQVLVSRLGLGRNPMVWDDALVFNPDRHMTSGKDVVLTDHNLHTFSFSTGPRGCPGVLLGSTMAIMLLARLVQGFTWELPPNKPLFDLEENFHDLAKAKPLMALATPRLPHHLYPTC
ncbi:hypothetical protein SSX86_025062 [Deinandra increscens subsp. villosa]|uniref:Cytochrome P450 n=1 Tax=Deinandra increscens subsp. villosa TaxID=3103831 RepID=A0AAP0CH01_9ASTR